MAAPLSQLVPKCTASSLMSLRLHFSSLRFPPDFSPSDACSLEQISCLLSSLAEPTVLSVSQRVRHYLADPTLYSRQRNSYPFRVSVGGFSLLVKTSLTE